MSQHHWYLFTDLMHMRENFAQQLNRPGYQIIDKDFLLELAVDPSHITNFYSKARPHKTFATEDADNKYALMVSCRLCLALLFHKLN